MKLTFYKYQGTGNDFVMIDNRDLSFPKKNVKLINHLCDRRFGIGADGLILLDPSETEDFKMIYYNADGNESTMCGNGGRCLVAFAKDLGVINSSTTFDAIDGIHHATIENDLVNLQMIDVNHINEHQSYTFLNTGSPHHVEFVEDVKGIDIKEDGSRIRYGAPYYQEGTNVNFAQQIKEDTFTVRTYERGVEDETFACGTGVTAVAIAAHKTNITKSNTIKLHVLGGLLEVSFNSNTDNYTGVYLKGPAKLVFEGQIRV